MGNCVLWLKEDIYPFFPAEVHTELHFSMHILSYLFSKMFHVFSSSSRVLYAHFLWMINFQNQFESHWHHLSFAMFDFSSWVSLIITSSSETSEKTLLLFFIIIVICQLYYPPWICLEWENACFWGIRVSNIAFPRKEYSNTMPQV